MLAGASEDNNENLGFVRGKEIVDNFSDYLLFVENAALFLKLVINFPCL
jgi:hypothetical protein